MSVCRVALPSALAAAGDLACCWGAALDGSEHCTCWQAEYDREQATPDTGAVVTTRDRMCASCAYRPGTQAWRNDQRDDLVADVAAFYCHDGTRQVLRFAHPNGAVVERVVADEHDPDTASWVPPFVHGIPFRADGQPAALCAGWVARRRALEAEAGAT